MAVQLKDIYFGRADGLQESEDEGFESLFYKGNQKYDLLCMDRNKFIISGRKGTGKTILAKYFECEMNKQGIPTETLTQRQFVLSTYLEKGNFDFDSKEQELFIEYTILRELSRIVLSNRFKLVKFKNIIRVLFIVRSLRKLEKFTSERFPAENFSKINYELCSGETSEISNGLTGGSSNNYSMSGKFMSSMQQSEKYAKNPYYNIIDSLKSNLFYLMKLLPINIIFDDLDELDVKLDGNKETISLLIAFINVTNRLNIEMRRNNIANSRIIILMRSDIIKVLNENSANLNKIVADSEIRLNWVKKSNGEKLHPLMEMIATKIRGSNSFFDGKSNEDVVAALFAYKVHGIQVMDYMLNNSFGRPRDIINMLNMIKNEYPNEEYFDADLFKNTMVEYSHKFIDELRNELSTHYEAEVIDEGFKIVKFINRKTFWLSDVVQMFEQHQSRIKYFKTPEEFVDYAYEYGIIGNTWMNTDANAKKRKLYSWKYREDGSDTPDYSKKFTVHLALRKSLQI